MFVRAIIRKKEDTYMMHIVRRELMKTGAVLEGVSGMCPFIPLPVTSSLAKRRLL